LNPDITLKQIKFPELKFIPQSFRSLFSSLIWRFRYASQFDAVYAHTLGAWSTKDNQVYIHEAADLDAKLKQTSGFLQARAYRLWRYLYLHLSLLPAQTIFAATPDCRRYLRQQGIPSRQIIQSGSFYDEKTFSYIKRATPNPITKIIFIGNPNDPNKNFQFIRDQFYHHRSYQVTITGGQTKYRDANFNFLGWQTPTQLRQTLADSHIMIMPSHSEGFSVALLEALATGIPCLVSQAASPPQLHSIKNLIIYTSPASFLPSLNRIRLNYSFYNHPDPALTHYASSVQLAKEFQVITKAVA